MLREQNGLNDQSAYIHVKGARENNLQNILAIELYTASQALSFGNGKTAPFLESIVGLFRQKIPIVKEDRVMHYDIVKASEFITSLEIDVKELF